MNLGYSRNNINSFLKNRNNKLKSNLNNNMVLELEKNNMYKLKKYVDKKSENKKTKKKELINSIKKLGTHMLEGRITKKGNKKPFIRYKKYNPEQLKNLSYEIENNKLKKYKNTINKISKTKRPSLFHKKNNKLKNLTGNILGNKGKFSLYEKSIVESKKLQNKYSKKKIKSTTKKSQNNNKKSQNNAKKQNEILSRLAQQYTHINSNPFSHRRYGLRYGGDKKYIINPLTGRKILKDGRTAKKLNL